MEQFINSANQPIHYRDYFREYYIKCPELPHIITMVFCPWCGARLPKELREEYFETLEKEFSLDLSISDIRERKHLIPPEFLTDEWWKKRGL